MRSVLVNIAVTIFATASAYPITPSASEHQLRAEQMRFSGISEHEIAEQLALPIPSLDDDQPLLLRLSSKAQSMFRPDSAFEKRDTSGDIAPGSLEAPQLLPRAAGPETLADSISRIMTVLRGEDLEKRKFGYEGKELEMRRPEGMRHWG
ncbi:hypothetical protein BCR34DRAFT_189901 [Clohesyomyces aquaticus]|uniref:Uncharacterized protein n=1 Tax=Clohesyomyces aquaticus TaxID=1231657 RepID=A0A1Y1ZY14_9PLEO|nr:hypothetical protein BCR34DRAFT_189901 [Clohesyomyces aquaticus]